MTKNLFYNNGLKANQIYYYNFWSTQSAKDIWFTRFIEHQKIFKNYKGRLNLYSVLGLAESLKKRKDGIDIFYSGENMLANRFIEYSKLCEERPFDLSLGFEYPDHDKYMRLPLWIITLFDPTADYEGIKNRVRALSEVKNDYRTGFCSLVASHDWNGLRNQMIDELSQIGPVSSGGLFRKNTDELNSGFANNKYNFIRQFKFNICAENSDATGYVTEKLFQAIEAGCIPIYWGSNNKPEIDILNQDAIIFWHQNENNHAAISLIRELYTDEKKYSDFACQPRLLPDAADIIWNYYQKLEYRLKELISLKS